MIVRDKPRAWELAFILRGSIVPKIWPQILLVFALSAFVSISQTRGWFHLSAIAALPFSLIGIALSIFSGFRNSASYERWWEARKILGQMVIEAKSLPREAGAFLPQDQAHRVALATIAFAHALRCHLRSIPTDQDVERFALAANAPLDARSPDAFLDLMSEQVASSLAKSEITPPIAQILEERIVGLTAVLAGTERIKLTPLPFAYSLLLHRTAYLFCFLLPFGLADTTGLWTPVLAAIVAYTFFGLDALGDELAAPFGLSSNALPLSAIARSIEINILRRLGNRELPPPDEPVSYILL